MPESDEFGPENIWLQQKGTTALTVDETICILRPTFSNLFIWNFGDIHWLVTSLDLAVRNLFLGDFLKLRIYLNQPLALETLKENKCCEET